MMRSERLRQSDNEEIHVQVVHNYVSFCINHSARVQVHTAVGVPGWDRRDLA